jgi:hypothetical protein
MLRQTHKSVVQSFCSGVSPMVLKPIECITVSYREQDFKCLPTKIEVLIGYYPRYFPKPSTKYKFLEKRPGFSKVCAGRMKMNINEGHELPTREMDQDPSTMGGGGRGGEIKKHFVSCK